MIYIFLPASDIKDNIDRPAISKMSVVFSMLYLYMLGRSRQTRFLNEHPHVYSLKELYMYCAYFFHTKVASADKRKMA